MVLLENEIESLPKFISAQKLLEDKFILEFSNDDDKNKKKIRKRTTIELTIGGDIACFVKPNSDFVCDTIVRGIVPKRHNGLESLSVFVLVTNNRFDFYSIIEIADKKYRILDRVSERIIVKRSIYNTSISPFLDNRFRKRFKKIQIQISGYNR